MDCLSLFFAQNTKEIAMNYTTAMMQLPLVKEAIGERVRTPEDTSRICEDMGQLAQETFQILCLNAKNYMTNRHLITLGIVDASLVHPREVMRPAIIESASAIVLVHNHPSGDPTPSAEDIRITRQLIEAAKIVDIRLLDHVIIGRQPNGEKATETHKSFLSMRESGLCDFE
jgi:DNA repair protein RadC